jgi:hypothetical protein
MSRVTFEPHIYILHSGEPPDERQAGAIVAELGGLRSALFGAKIEPLGQSEGLSPKMANCLRHTQGEASCNKPGGW